MGNEQTSVVIHFDDLSRQVGWSKTEFLHGLVPGPTAAAPGILTGT
jgi:hypothetical protein